MGGGIDGRGDVASPVILSEAKDLVSEAKDLVRARFFGPSALRMTHATCQFRLAFSARSCAQLRIALICSSIVTERGTAAEIIR